ncbi:MAG: beta-ketoacyl-ACP synthase [Bacteroidetes bacterium]|nr:MAG: beta-ketoacyl-ACP synthase [Bacteroidota bacterium]PTM10425.1 MAG: beta-ketoacyl-ACP synthase [Bacteroidota bacterium]
MENRVVITGMGVAAPNGVGLTDFERAIRAGTSGIQYQEQLAAMNFSCCVGGIPPVTEALILQYLTPLQLRNFSSSGIIYGCIAGVDAWRDAGLAFADDEPDWDSGCIFGTGISGVEKMREASYLLDEGRVKRLGSTSVAQTMSSGVSAYLSGILGLGNQVTTNSAACATGTEAILMAYDRIRAGRARRMLAGSSSDHGPYLWGGFDAMKVMTFKHNNDPTAASRPMSATASGFVPGSGAGALLLESLESARERGAKIYAEVLGGSVNAGGQRNGGTMTAPNPLAVRRCLHDAIANAGIHPHEIDVINGHLTATIKDPEEVENWAAVLGRRGRDFPYIHSLKAMVGHCIGAAGSIESVAAVLGLYHDFIFPSINCEDVHPEIAAIIDKDRIPTQVLENTGTRIVAKAGFGFGDVNSCIILKKHEHD